MESSSLNFSKTLDKLYDEVKDNYKQLETIQSNSNSSEYQKLVNSGIEISKILWDRIHELDLFSSNETLDDMSTESLKYVIIPGMIGHFLYHKMNENRLEILREVQKYYNIFTELMNDYGFKESEYYGLNIESRDDKIKQYREEKIFNERLNILDKLIQEDKVVDETKREYYTIVIKQWISKVNIDLKLIKDEIFILENRKNIEEKPTGNMKPPIESFVITRDMVNNTVFGMGYKNLPTYSLEDFYIMQVEMGQVPYPTEKGISKPSTGPTRIVPDDNLEHELESAENDLLEDSHDINARMKKINWDNFKDENRRGCGNTLNRG